MRLVSETRGLVSGGFRRRAARWGALLVSLSATRGALAAEPAAPRKVAIGFSNLIARLDEDQIGIAKAEYRIHILEALRRAGFNAVGAENLVFGRDEGDRADLVLGGTVTELSCRSVSQRLRCSVGIEWQLLDRRSDGVVYRVLSRFAGLDLPRNNDAAIARQLTLGALGSLMKRDRFKQLAEAERAPVPKDAVHPPATFARCDVPLRQLPADFDSIAAATWIVKSGDGVGSGFSISPDGLVMTAAHVVADGDVSVRTRDGTSLPAEIVRISRKQDVALLALAPSQAGYACLALQPDRQNPGTDVYAIGSPGGEALGFSLSRGIVSGIRTMGEVELIQTDASISPGNSGGPLVDGQGRAVGVVSRKLAGHAVEGLGFAIPIGSGLSALALSPGDATADELRRTPKRVEDKGAAVDPQDSPDPPVSLDPEGDRRRAIAEDDARRARERDAATPPYVKPMRWLGLGASIVGAVGIVATYSESQGSQMTRSEYQSIRLKNDIFWVGALLGGGAFVTSFVLEPKLGPSHLARSPRWQVAGGAGHVSMKVSFQ
jgi:serine protease Do